ncbi:MAG: type IX secretion system ring subunit PorN/GldN [Mucilaginibacter sp.]
MKRKILVILLCFAFVATYGQQRRRRTPANNNRPATTTQQAANRPAPTQQAPDTTAKKQAAADAASHFNRPQDGYFKKTNILNAKVTPYATIRESDAPYVKRVWREIDVREKMNQYMASPKQALINILMDAIAAGELTAYDANPDLKNDPDGDGFYTRLSPAQAKLRMADSVPVDKFNDKGDKIGTVMQPGQFIADSIVKFRIKEDWVFDRQRSTFEPRIIGIAPMIRKTVGGVTLDYQPAFWIYFPDARQILATKEAVNRNNDNTGLSYDDIFMKRIFTSYVVKVTNDKNDRIKDYAQGIDRLYESERVKKELMDWELNLWQY